MKTRKPLKRSTKPLKRTPLKRASVRASSDACTFRVEPIRKKRSKPRRVSVVRDQTYMDWLKERRCVACECAKHVGMWNEFRPFARVIDPAHTVNNGRSSKGPDSSCIPLCRHHHDEMDGRLSTEITTRAAFAAKYGLDLEKEAAGHFTLYKALEGTEA